MSGRPQSEMPIEMCREGYHCTDHPYEGQRCCRCGTADFNTPNPLAGLTKDQRLRMRTR